MNRDRRKRLDEVRNRIEIAKDDLTQALEDLGSIRDEEQEAFDNLSEGLQQTDQGQRTEAAADALGSAHSDLESMSDVDLQGVLDNIDEAAGA